MKKTFPLIVFLTASAVAFGQFAPTPQVESVEIDGYVAKVNDRVITKGDVWAATAPRLPELHRTYQGAQLEEKLKEAFEETQENLIERLLIMEAFAKRGGQIPDQYVNDEIKRMINERFKGDEAQFEHMLAEQKKTRVEFMETIREGIVVDMMLHEEVAKRARVTPAQIKAEYEANKESRYSIPEKVEHSVILLNKGNTEEDQAVKRKEAEQIRQRLLAGADFAAIAKELSEGSRAADGGKFPWMQPKDIRAELQETLIALPVGEVSEIIESDTSLYIVKVHARRQSGFKSFDDVRKSIKTSLNTKERARLKKRWMALLKASNYIVRY